MAALCRLRVIPYPAGTGSRNEVVPQPPRTGAAVRRDFFNTLAHYRPQYLSQHIVSEESGTILATFVAYSRGDLSMAASSAAHLLGSLTMLCDQRSLGLVMLVGRVAMVAPAASQPR
jgi:hypothetical protein